MMLIVIFLGCFMDWIGICLLTMPVFVPIVDPLGYDPIWFGVLFSMNVQIGFLSPPFGGAAFYLKGVAPPDMTLKEIFSVAVAVHRSAIAGAWPGPVLPSDRALAAGGIALAAYIGPRAGFTRQNRLYFPP